MQTKDLRILVIIINYKTPKLVCQAIQSVIPQLDKQKDKVCVIDNDSQDDSVGLLNQFLEENDFQSLVNIICSSVNGGFSAGNNLGIQSARAQFYLLLNSDAYLTDNALSTLINTIQKSPKTGIVAPRLNWQNGIQQTTCFNNLTPLNSLLMSAKTGIISRFLKLLAIYEVAIPCSFHDSAMPDWLSFACVLLKAEMINEIGLMDEGYFMYREDNDYCRRANESGWQLRFEPDAQVVHLNQGASNQTIVKRLPKYYFESRTRYFLKYYGRFGLLLANLLWNIGRCIYLIREWVERKPKVFHSTMWFDIWTGFFTPLKKV